MGVVSSTCNHGHAEHDLTILLGLLIIEGALVKLKLLLTNCLVTLF